MINREKHYKSLELDKVLELLASETSCRDAYNAALELRPETDIRLAGSLIKQTEDAYILLAKFGSPSFGGLKNIANQMRRAQAGGVLNLRELLDVAETLRVMRSLSQWRDHCIGVKVCLDLLFEGLYVNKYLEDRITSCVISEEEMADDASPELASIRRKMREASSRVREQLDKMIRSPHYQKFLQESIVTQRGGRYVVPVKAECRGEVPGLVHDTSSSGATVFVEPMGVVEANNDIKVLKSKEEAEIERILYELSAECGSFAGSALAGYECAVELNLIIAKAKLAFDMKASVPVLNDEGIVELKKARHPLIDKSKVVPTDIRVGADFDTLVITGPNTGGKTVSLKTIGLLSVMAMCGLMIPAADGSKISVFDNVLVDVGDEQSIEQSLSTFSSHMKNIIEIMGQTGSRSLVLLDELGAGTDPVEGAALAIAMLEKLAEKGAKIVATTHYAELKAYALQTPRVENGCCEFDVTTLRPTYRLLIGVPGRSNAFAISERLGMDKSVVERARELVSSEDTMFEDVVERLERSRQSMEEQEAAAKKMFEESQRMKREAESRKRQLDGERRREIERAKNEAKQIVDKARLESQRLLDELDELRKQKESEDAKQLAQRARQQIRARMGRLDEVADPVEENIDDEDYVLPRPLKIGDTVFITGFGNKGEVISLPDKSGNVQVRTGSLTTRVKADTLRLVGGPKKKSEPKGRRVKLDTTNNMNTTAQHSIDLRGKMVDEAIIDLDAFIDKSILLGVDTIMIIHGKGTGALRAGIQQHLRRHPFIKSYRLGTYGEGAEGVTIAELK